VAKGRHAAAGLVLNFSSTATTSQKTPSRRTVPPLQFGRAASRRSGDFHAKIASLGRLTSPRRVSDKHFAGRRPVEFAVPEWMMKLPEQVAKAGVDALNILVADADPQVGAVIHQVGKAGGGGGEAAFVVKKLRVAINVDATLLEMKRDPADVVFVCVQIDDNAGLELIKTIRARFPRTAVVAVSRVRKAAAGPAFAAGACDLLAAPADPADVQRALAALVARRGDIDRLEKRNARLRTACRRLNKARHEISQQVDLLCNDLVRAYQDMAQQLNVTQTAADYAQAVQGEFEIEGILRRTMEWLLQKLGPVNAAVYLPAGEAHFALGAYLNLDTHADAPLIEALSRTLVQQARGAASMQLDDDRQLEELFGDEAGPLLGRSWLATGCQTPRQCLAVIVIFGRQREGDAPGSNESGTTRPLVDAIAPVLAERIEQALGFHHRLHPFAEDDDQ
jgi:DNA-binding NarL/FixJ family response regulator